MFLAIIGRCGFRSRDIKHERTKTLNILQLLCAFSRLVSHFTTTIVTVVSRCNPNYFQNVLYDTYPNIFYDKCFDILASYYIYMILYILYIYLNKISKLKFKRKIFVYRKLNIKICLDLSSQKETEREREKYIVLFKKVRFTIITRFPLINIQIITFVIIKCNISSTSTNVSGNLQNGFTKLAFEFLIEMRAKLRGIFLNIFIAVREKLLIFAFR